MKDEISLKAISEKMAEMEARLRLHDDVEQIRELKALYCRYCDGGWDPHGPTHMGPVDELFVEDGVWDGGAHLPVFKGRAAIREYIHGLRSAPFAIHNVMNPIIKVEGDEADGHWHVIACFTFATGESRWVVGNYIERYIRTAQGWRIKYLRAAIARSWPQPAGWGEDAAPLDLGAD